MACKAEIPRSENDRTAALSLPHHSLYICTATSSVKASVRKIRVPTLLSTTARMNLTAASVSTAKGGSSSPRLRQASKRRRGLFETSTTAHARS
eukprot:5856105-Pleurochrysis_carterae.AAC.2